MNVPSGQWLFVITRKTGIVNEKFLADMRFNLLSIYSFCKVRNGFYYMLTAHR